MNYPPAGPLSAWLGRQRWCSADGDPRIRLMGVPREESGVTVQLAVVELTGPTGDVELYFVPLARSANSAAVLDPIYTDDLCCWFDALAHATTTRLVAELLTDTVGVVTHEWIAITPLDLDGLQIAQHDQSNTTIFTERGALKFVRRLHPGRSPEIDSGRVLSGRAPVPALCGWSTLRIADSLYDVLVVHERLAGTDGFTLAVDDAARSRAGQHELHFPGAAYELGIALGVTHQELATALGESVDPRYGAELCDRLTTRLAWLVDIPELAPYLPTAEAIYAQLAQLSGPIARQRIHGDLHLGQTLFSDERGWHILDFEGEPRQPIDARTAPESPLKDVAGVLRSFAYAARWSGPSDSEWESRTSKMFLEGYHLQRPDFRVQPALDAFVLDKALYEVGYESRHRPDRVAIPLSAVAAICGSQTSTAFGGQ